MIDKSLDYQQVIRRQGFRLTPQRQMILDAVREAHGHSTPEEIYGRVQTKATAINRATVYRNLEFLLELGLVTVAQVKGNQTVYESSESAPHHHIICQRCNQVAHVAHRLVEPMFAQIETESGFTVNTDHLVLFGVCSQCRQLTVVSQQ
ncbi:MAG: transcriptional repressor [Chloroflexota bacterium]|nr:transcriptional repressor [Chloroflexota bacterium]